MLYDFILDTLKFITHVLIRLLVAIFLWNYAIAPYMGWHLMTFSVIFHLWLFISALTSNFAIQQVIYDDENEQ